MINYIVFSLYSTIEGFLFIFILTLLHHLELIIKINNKLEYNQDEEFNYKKT